MKKNIIFILGVIAMIGIIICSLNIESVDKHYESTKQPSDAIGQVTIAIRCDTVLESENYELLEEKLQKDTYVPKNGVILEETTYSFGEGETVFDVLSRAVKEQGIAMDYQGADQNVYGSVYIQGINHLYEFSAGPLSGWMYQVNGEFPDYGCSKYYLQDGDKIEFVYTCDLGRDLGRE